MSKVRPSQGFKRFELRGAAPGFPRGFRGVVTEGDPGSIPIDTLYRAFNLRYRQGGEWWIRPGLVAVGDTFHDSTSCIHSMLSYRTDPIRLWITIFGCFGAGSVKGGTIYLFDPEQEPKLQAYTQYFSDVDRQIAIGEFDGRLFFGEGPNLRQITIVNTPYGTAIDSLANTYDTSLFSFPGFRISALQDFDGKLFIALDGGAGASKIAVYDGVAVYDGTAPTVADLTGINPVTRFGLWRNKLVAGFATGTGHIRVRDAGTVPGTWTTVAAAGVAAAQAPSMVSFKDTLYIANGAQDIFSYDGTTLASARNIPGAGSASSAGGISSLAVFNNDLYYAWNKLSNVHAMLGRFDSNSVGSGIEWTDEWKDFTAQNTVGNRLDMLTIVRSLTVYRDVLFASFHNGGVFGFASNVPIALASARNIDTAGLWTAYTQDNTLIGGTTFPLLDLFVH